MLKNFKAILYELIFKIGNSKYIIYSIPILIFYSCTLKQNQIEINGNISNLPDGTIYLCQDNYIKKIDSAKTLNGKFIIIHKFHDEKIEPVYLTLKHVDNNGILRFVSFSTNAKYNKAGYNSQFFLADSSITIKCSFEDNTPVGINFGDKTKFVNCPKILAGYQTNALFNTDGDLFSNINSDTFKKVISKIKEYPNSFHLLYQISNNKNSFTSEQVALFLKLFKGEIVDSDTFKNLKKYNEIRFSKKEIKIPLLKDNYGRNVTVLDSKFKKHLVVFWASWCEPCRQEIPSLKKLYPRYKNDIEFISISTDENDAPWQKALEKEQMQWKQLILKEKSEEYVPMEIIFQLSPSIPYIVLIDNDNNVTKSHVGLMTEIEMEKFLKD